MLNAAHQDAAHSRLLPRLLGGYGSRGRSVGAVLLGRHTTSTRMGGFGEEEGSVACCWRLGGNQGWSGVCGFGDGVEVGRLLKKERI